MCLFMCSKLISTTSVVCEVFERCTLIDSREFSKILFKIYVGTQLDNHMKLS